MASHRVIKAIDQLQIKISEAMKDRKPPDIKPPSFRDLVETITKSPLLWDHFRIELKSNSIVTSAATSEYLAFFLMRYRKCIEKEYYILNSIDLQDYSNVNSIAAKSARRRSSASEYLDKIRDMLASTTNTIFKNCEAETDSIRFEERSDISPIAKVA